MTGNFWESVWRPEEHFVLTLAHSGLGFETLWDHICTSWRQMLAAALVGWEGERCICTYIYIYLVSLVGGWQQGQRLHDDPTRLLYPKEVGGYPLQDFVISAHPISVLCFRWNACSFSEQTIWHWRERRRLKMTERKWNRK